MNGEIKQTICFAEFELDAAHRRLMREGRQVALNAKAFDLLVFLAENVGRVVTKDEILDAVWKNQFVEEANLTVQMSALRKVLGERIDAPRFLVTVPGKGYEFIADVDNGNGEIVIEKHKLSHITIEQETQIDAPYNDTSVNKSGTVVPGLERIRRQRSDFMNNRFKYGVLAVAVLICGVVAFGSYLYFQPKKSKPPFQKINLKRLTNNGKVAGVAISPDGKYIAYVQGENDGNSLWVQQIGTASHIQLLPPTKAEFWDLTFSPDGAFIYYNLFTSDKSTQLFRIPSLGGIVQKIPNVEPFSISFSPDGKQFAFISSDSAGGFNYLTIADADGTNLKFIGKKALPNTFIFDGHLVAWSPDGEKIACFVNHLEADANYESVVEINVDDGAEKPLGLQQWHDVESLRWLKDGSGLLIANADKSSAGNQVWFLSYPEGQARQITNDLNSYSLISVANDSNLFAALQTGTTSGIFVGELGTNDFKEIVSEVGNLNPLVWIPDGRIVFRSAADGVSNLWTINADGSNRRQLTVDAQVSERGLSVSPDGKYIVFVSWRSGKSNLWRVDADGNNLTQLTNGEADAYPRFTPDSQSVIYQKGILTNLRLWEVSINGGVPVQLTDFLSKWVAVSEDGNQLSYFHLDDDKWRFGFLSLNGQPNLADIDVPVNLVDHTVYWSPDNQNLFYINTEGNTGNLWMLPLDGTKSKPVTNFTSQLLADFSLSPDGTHLALARSVSVSDVVLITNEKMP